MRKPFFSNCSMMSPTPFLATASGFTMVRVRCRVFIVGRESSVLSRCLFRLLLGTWYLVLNFNSQRRYEGFPDGRRRFCHADSRRFHGPDLLRSRSLAAGDDRSGMAHAASRRRGLPGNEAHDRLLHFRFHKFRCGFFGVTADLTNHDHGFGLRIAIEQVERIQEIGSDNRIAADADGGGLSNATLRELMHRLISERPRARYDSDGTFFVNRS